MYEMRGVAAKVGVRGRHAPNYNVLRLQRQAARTSVVLGIRALLVRRRLQRPLPIQAIDVVVRGMAVEACDLSELMRWAYGGVR